MPFVKLDCGILNSTLWFERTAREIFITALLMAEPFETTEALPQLALGSLELTGWSVPPGWYGFVPAASVGILHRAGITEGESGLAALASLGEPEGTSRSKEFDGRRLVRVDGGFIVLNYMKYRERDYTAAQRSKRYRQRMADKQSRRDIVTSHRNITQAEAEVEAEVEERTRDGASAVVFASFPTRTGSWTITEPDVCALEATYQHREVRSELRKALTWLEANPSRRKTARGMPRFLVNWLNRASERAPAPAGRIHGATCPHVPRCARTADCIAKVIAEARRA